MKIIAAMLSFGMPELTDKTVEFLTAGGFSLGETLFVFENHSDDEYARGDWKTSKYVTNFTGSNLRMTGGFNHICDWVSQLPSQDQPDVLWLCTNDFDVLGGRAGMPARIEAAFNKTATEVVPVGWWHPSLEVIPEYAYPWMFRSMTKPGLRATWMTDFICPAIRWDLLNEIKNQHGFWFDPQFYRGWGIDYETCYFVRKLGYTVCVDDYIQIRHEASKTYDAGVAPESKDQFYNSALSEMHRVMYEKYGRDWLHRMQDAR